jgi:hypothetical protein
MERVDLNPLHRPRISALGSTRSASEFPMAGLRGSIVVSAHPMNSISIDVRHLTRAVLILLILGAAPIFASAPASVAGMIFRADPLISSTRSGYNWLVRFNADQSYSYLLWQNGSVFDSISLGVIFKIGSGQPKDGSYTYTKIDDATARLVQTSADGSIFHFTLHFLTATSGTFDEDLGTPGLYLISGNTFTLVDQAELQTLPLLNTALRGNVSPGHSLIAGIVIPGTTARTVLIRAVGPGLTALGVAGVWADPDFQIYSGTTPLNTPLVATWHFAHYADWSVDPTGVLAGTTATAFQNLFAYLGAFPLTVGSKDAADVVRLDPGAYTIVGSAANGDAGGEALIEVYLLP